MATAGQFLFAGIAHHAHDVGHLVGQVGRGAIKVVEDVLDHILIAHADDPHADHGGDQGHRIAQHGAPGIPVDVAQGEIPAQGGHEPQKQGGQKVGQNGGQHITGNAQIKDHQQQNVEADGHQSAQHAVQGEELGVFQALDKLGAHRVQCAHQHIEEHKEGIALHKLQQREDGGEQKQHTAAAKHRHKPHGEDAFFVASFLQGEADDGVGNARRHQGH